MIRTSAFCLLLAAGAAAAFDRPVATDSSTPRHLYLNAATGEVIATAPGAGGVGGVGPRSTGSGEVWIADNTAPCGLSGPISPFALVDQPDLDSLAAVNSIVADWGDIPADTVVDCVQVTWTTAHIDQDADGDGIADGVEGFGATWTWLDLYDRPDSFCHMTFPIVSMTLFNLPGNDQPAIQDYATYFLTVDLADFDPSLSFEITDTDGDPQGAAHHNPFIGLGDLNFDGLPDSDLDGDGLADFGYAQRFHQPGSTDFNGDGQPDGDPQAVANAGVVLVAPRPGEPLPAGQGMDDAYDVWLDKNDDGFWEPYATIAFGGFTCDADGSGVPGDSPDDFRPFAQFYHVLFGPAGAEPCPADVFPPPNGDGVVNFFDLSYFIDRYPDPTTDIFPPGGDGVVNFFDIAFYLDLFGQGCP